MAKISLQNSLREFGLELASLTTEDDYKVFHYWRPLMSAPFIVWTENGEAEAFNGDNKKAELVMDITIDVYTATEFDPLLDAVFHYLNDKGIPFTLDSVEFEEDTKTIHYAFSCEAVMRYGEI